MNELMIEQNEETGSFITRLKDCFDTMVVYKDLNKNNFISCIYCLDLVFIFLKI